MLTLTPDQFAILSLPDPSLFAPKLAAETRRDHPSTSGDIGDEALQQDTERSYIHASETLHITHLPTLVAWVKADTAWAKGLRREPSIDLRVRASTAPNLTAQDILSGLKAGSHWPKEND